MTDREFFYLDSTSAKEVIALGGSLGDLLPEKVEDKLKEKFK